MKSSNRLIVTTSPQTHPARKPRLTTHALYRRTRYLHTGKERDSETGLYYYGARYLDSKTGRWLSGDPAVSDYVPSAPVDDEAKKQNQNLPGMGGVFNYANLHVYHYAGNNPVKLVDPDGEVIESAWDAISLGMGIVSLGVNIKEGNIKGAIIDAAGIAVDAAALGIPFVPGGAGVAIKAIRAAESVGSGVDDIKTVKDGIKGGDTKAIIKGSAGLGSKALSVIGGRGFAKAADYAPSFHTKYEQIGNMASAAAAIADGGVLASNVVDTVEKSIEQQKFFTFSNDEP
jgi:RHS repeat-associated protein